MAKDGKISIWQRLIEFKIKYATIILVLIAIGTGFFSYKIATGLKVYTDFFQLYPPKHEYIKLYNEYRKMFGTANILTMIVEVKEGDIYSVDTINKIDRLTKAMLKVKGVNPLQLISLTHPKLKDISVGNFGVKVKPMIFPGLPETEEDLKRLKNKVYTNEGIRGLYVTPDDKAALINAGFWEEGVDLKRLHADMMQLKAAETDETHNIYITGYPMLYGWIAHYTGKLAGVFIATVGVLVALLFFYFRSTMGVVIPMISGLLSAIWGLGFASVMGWNIDPLILVVPMLLSARALSHSVQCLERYYEDYCLYNDKKKAIIMSYTYLYRPAILSIVTDGLGVLTIAVCTIPLMQKLAFVSSFWIISIYVSVVTLNPILVMLFPAPSKKDQETWAPAAVSTDATCTVACTPRPGDRFYLKICNIFAYLTQSWRKWAVAGVMVFIVVVCGYYSSKLKVGDTSAGKAILYPDHPYNVAADKLNKDFVGSSQMILIAEGKNKETMKDADALVQLENMQLHAQKLPNVGGTLTITNVIKRQFRMFHEGDPKWGLLPDDPSHLAQVFFLFGSNMAPGEMDRFISVPDYNNATMTMFMRDYNNQVIKDTIGSIENYIAENPSEKIRFRLAGGILGILAAVNQEVEWSYWINMGLIFSVTFLLCALTYRSLWCALILITPLLISQLLSDTFMLAWGIDLNINSLPVAAIGVGVGVDYGIYILSRLSEEYQLQNDFESATCTTINTTGKAVLFTATTLVAGVIFWTFSIIKFQAEMGMLLGFLMVFNMIGAILFIPVMVSIIGPEKTLRKYKTGVSPDVDNKKVECAHT
jgi:predicted RND superfamily exporter protein